MFLSHADSLLNDKSRRDLDEQGFKQVADAVALRTGEGGALPLPALPVTGSGIYCWTIRPSPAPDCEHVLYVGRTNAIERRFREYRRGFQPHSVNDYKLLVFQQELKRRCTGAHLALYFRPGPHPGKTLQQEETAAIGEFHPLLNRARMQVPDAERQAFQAAFERYYAAGFVAWLPAHPTP